MLALLPLLAVLTVAPAPTPAPSMVKSPLGFELELPAGFEPQDLPEGGQFKHSWSAHAGQPTVEVVAVQAYGKPIGRECIPLDKLPRTLTSFVTTWDGLSVCGLRGPQASPAGEMVDLYVELPLAPGAIALHVTGLAANEAALRTRLEWLLAHLKGPTTWRVAFGCFTVDLPEGWGQLKSASPRQVQLARRATFAHDGQALRPSFRITTLPTGPVTLDKAEASAVAESQTLSKEKVAVKRVTLAGQPASELRFVRVDQGITLHNRIVVVVGKDEAYTLSLGTFADAVQEVEPVADALLASARFTCAK